VFSVVAVDCRLPSAKVFSGQQAVAVTEVAISVVVADCHPQSTLRECRADPP
jgi:hypothetical protein